MKVAIIGAGKLGNSLISALLGGENEIIVVDMDEDKIQKVKDRFDVQTVVGNAIRTELLEDIEIGTYDLCIACTESDEINIIICKFARDLGCRKTIARIRTPENVGQEDFICKSMGINRAINPDMDCAQEIFKYLTERNSLQGGRLISGKMTIVECGIEKLAGFADHEVREVAGNLEGILIAAVSRNGKIIVPNGCTKLLKGDVIYLIGQTGSIEKLGISGGVSKNGRARRVMIAGGGKTGYYLASLLEKAGVSTRIVELKKSRCEYLSLELENTLVICGDATDKTLLSEENLEGMDAFVALTGFDEENLLISMIAKRNGVPNVVTKLSHDSYGDLVDALGVDMVINPLEISAAGVLRYLEKDGIVVFSQIIQGQAEFVEITAEAGMPLVDKKLMELEIPEGVLIASVNRGDQLIIPGGSFVILPGDSVTILSLLSSTASLEALLKR